MQRIFCDGCWEAGIQNDLTERKNDAYVPVDLGARRLHLCPERCVPIWWQFERELLRVRDEYTVGIKARREAFMAEFWGALKHGSKTTDQTPNEPDKPSGDAETQRPAEPVRLRQCGPPGHEEGEAPF